MRTHELKCWPEFFRCIEDGSKTFELRKDDRGFHVRDVLWLREWHKGDYTGRDARRTVSYVLSGIWLEPGYVVMGLLPAAPAGEAKP